MGAGARQVRRLIKTALVLAVAAVGIVSLTVSNGCAQGISSDQISAALNQSASNGASPQSLWNMGYMFFNQYPPTRDLAQQIYLGYQGAQGRTPEQNKALQQAAGFWQKKYEYWGRNAPAGSQSPKDPKQMPYYSDPWESTMKLRAPQSGGPPIQPYHPRGFKKRR
jgi:hypothetical protein